MFSSRASNLVPADMNGLDDVFLHDLQAKTTERISVATGGTEANGFSREGSLSANGRYVVFVSAATNLVANDTNNKVDVFVRDRVSATTSRVSVATGGAQVNGDSIQAVISANGRYVAFASSATNLVANDTNSLFDIFLFDRETQQTARVSVASTNAQAVDGQSIRPWLSADGLVVVFESEATNLVAGDTNGVNDVFVRDVQAGSTTRASVGPGGLQANNTSQHPSISGDRRFVAFTSLATNLEPGNNVGLFVHDRQTATTSPLSVVNVLATENTPGRSRISADGSFVCFETMQAPSQVFLVKRQTLNKTLLSVVLPSAPANGSSAECMVNGDGTVTVFRSAATNLVTGDTNLQNDIFVRAIPGNATSTMAIDKTVLTFGAVTSGGSFVSHTAAQIVRLTQSGRAPVTWNATSNQPWLHVSPASGSGSGLLSIAVAPAAGLASSGSVTGSILISLAGATTTVPPIAVTLTLVPNGTAAGPFGTVDTPTDNRTGVTGAVPFTGWALDDIEVMRVLICRAAFGRRSRRSIRTAPARPRCSSASAVFIDGARPDVQPAFPTYPLATRAGWGFMVLTNMLPDQGNGTYRFMMCAQDREGHTGRCSAHAR